MSGEDTRLGPQDWQQLQAFYDQLPPVPVEPGGLRQGLMLGALLDLHDQVTQLQLDQEDDSDRAAFNVRLEALKAAREHVSSLPSEQVNQRGYRDHALRPTERVNIELQTARYLLGG